MRSVFEWLCHTEDLMKVDVRDDVDPQGIRIFLFTRITRIIRITRITRIIQGMVIHIKCS